MLKPAVGDHSLLHGDCLSCAVSCNGCYKRFGRAGRLFARKPGCCGLYHYIDIWVNIFSVGRCISVLSTLFDCATHFLKHTTCIIQWWLSRGCIFENIVFLTWTNNSTYPYRLPDVVDNWPSGSNLDIYKWDISNTFLHLRFYVPVLLNERMQ